MKKQTKESIIKIVYLLIIIAYIIFIFSNSVESREASTGKSTGLLSMINSFLDSLNLPIRMSEHFLRKTAHFVEFFLLGLMFSSYLGLYKKEQGSYYVYASFASCLVAMTDETIQYFSNRGSMLLDVWLDFSAASLAIALFFLWYKHLIKKKNK